MAYGGQIYCDFSGYSDMAIGTAKMIGYDLPRNFDLPYLGTNVTEFWRRWHMTLSSWLRDYLYIPSGGNRRGTRRKYLNLIITMSLGGLWHGASWNFVAWGVLHGAALSVHRGWREVTKDRFPLWTPLATAITFVFVMLCWIPFRAPDFATSWLMLTRCLWPHPGALWLPSALGWCLALLVAGHTLGYGIERVAEGSRSARWPQAILDVFAARLRSDQISGWWVQLHAYPAAASFLLACWVLLLFLFVPTTTQPFIYFQF